MNTIINKFIKDTPVSLSYLYPREEKNFKSYELLLKFLEKEIAFWIECNVGSAQRILNNYNVLLSNIKNIEIQYSSNNLHDENSIYNLFTRYINDFNTNFVYNFYSATPFARRIKSLSLENVTKMNAFIAYVQGNSINTNDPISLSGAIEADKYLNQKLFSDKFYDSYNDVLNNTVNECFENINEMHEKYSEDYSKLSDEYKLFAEKTGEWKTNTENELHNYIEDERVELDSLIDEKRDSLEAYEKLYIEKLKLESPAKYWLELENKYKKEGGTWLKATVYTSIILVLLLLSILYNMPEELKILNKEFSFDSLRSTLLLTILVSIGIYLLRLFVKLALSAYHLSRDAKERYQLSYFYLSLIKDSAIGNEDKAIVLQSLFSRADTGLLKGDSSPAFPVDGMLAQVLKNVK